ncbi:MAG: AAA family ATPase [Deltaproteobacteria bacterium]|nr:AAA family ATPase [Deltaproteobacteria bacterium]
MATRRNKKTEETKSKTRVDWAFVEMLLAHPRIRTLYLYGPPGVGKTFAAYHKGRVHNGVYCITLTEDTPAAELRGMFVPQGNEFIWRDGPFTAAMREGALLVINELSHASPDVQALLYPVLESEETAKLTLPTNETVRPAPDFHVVVTDNESPSSLPPALVDRFNSIVEIDAPHPDALAKLSEPLRRAAVQSVGLEPERAVTLRGWLTLDMLQQDMGLEKACRAVFGRERGAQIHDAIVLMQGELAF